MGSLWSVKEILNVTKGTLLTKDPSLSLKSFSLEIKIDSRKPIKNKAFLAIKGNLFDGHRFAHQAYKKGAKLLIVESLKRLSHPLLKELNFNQKTKGFFPRLNSKKISIIKVKNTLKALTHLGQYCREKKLKNSKLIAITGSSGKTTTKEFTATLIKKFLKTYVSPKSFNNHLGVPLSLLEAPPESEVIILEIGMNRKGEIKRLCQLAKPNFCLVTNVGLAHRGNFKSQREIAQEKEKLYSSAPKKSHFVFNYDNPLTFQMFEKFKKEKKGISFFSSLEKKATVFMKAQSFEWTSLKVEGHIQKVKGSAKVPVFGKQNTFNLMGASALALQIGIKPKQIWASLPFCKNPWGRSQLIQLKNGTQVLFDAYNASPESVFKLIENIYEIQKKEKKNTKNKVRNIALFGAMMELGEKSKDLHYQWGKKASLLNFKRLWFLGPPFRSFQKGLQEKTKKKQSQHYFTKDYDPKILNKVLSNVKANDFIVIKGSRAMKLEQILDDLNSKI